MKFVSALLTTAAVVALATGAQAATVLRSADVHPDGYPTVEAVKYMSELLGKETNGELSIQVFTSGQLGEEKDTIQQTQFGVIDLLRVSSGVFNTLVPETKVIALPFVFRSEQHMYNVVDGPIGDEILAAFAPHNLVGLAYYDGGVRSFYTQKPVKTPDDLKGQKIRVMQSDVFVDMMKAFGANPTPMPMGEVFSALQTGVVDGAENNWPSLESARHFEVIKNYNLTGHLMVPEVLVMSKKSWDKLTPAQQAAVRKTAKQSVPKNRELWHAREKVSEAKVRAAGVTINEVDKTPFIEKMAPVHAKYADNPKLKDLLARIQAVK